ncbi:MAG: GIY-YIG nuclease family protein [Pseudomonadota bacterium]
MGFELGDRPVIYFIQSGDGGPVKIGFASNLYARFHQLQSGNPVGLKIIGARPGDRVMEARYHVRFQKHRLRGEWFEPCAAVIMEAGKLARRWNVPALDNVFRPLTGPIVPFSQRARATQ